MACIYFTFCLNCNFRHIALFVLAAAAAKSLQSCPTVQPHRRQPTRPPPSLGFSRQEHWSGLPFPSPMHESESEVAQWCLTLSDPMDYSLPGSSLHGIFQAGVLEWDAIVFSAFDYMFQVKNKKNNFVSSKIN